MKSFCFGGPIRVDENHYIDRSHEVGEIAEQLEKNFVLLHAHRQAGKSSLILPLLTHLESREKIAFSITFQGLAADEIWTQVSCRMLNCPAVRGKMQGFTNGTEFLNTFTADKWGGKDVVIIIDEFDQLLSLETFRNEFLGILRSIQTTNRSSQERISAIQSILGIGVLNIRRLMEPMGDSISPFNTCSLYRLQQPSFDAVADMFNSYGQSCGLPSTEIYAADIFAFTSGHPGLTSFFGQIFENWVKTIGTEKASLGGWMAYLTNTAVYTSRLQESSTSQAIIVALSEKVCPTHLYSAVRANVAVLLHGDNQVVDPSSAQSTSDTVREAIDYLEAEGIIVRIAGDGGVPMIRFSASILRIILFNIFVDSAKTVTPGLSLPLKQAGELDMLKCLCQAIPFLDRRAIFHSKRNPCRIRVSFRARRCTTSIVIAYKLENCIRSSQFDEEES
jgi:hypothetical protein